MGKGKQTSAEYVNANPRHQWKGGNLRSLWEVLKREADAAPEKPHWYVLRNGALVTLMRNADGRYELSIRRREKPRNDRGFRAFAIECATFIREFRVEGWVSERIKFSGIGNRYVSPLAKQETLDLDAPTPDAPMPFVEEPFYQQERVLHAGLGDNFL